MGVFVSTPPSPDKVVHVRLLFAPRGLRGKALDTWAVVACTWRGAWWQGVLLAPPSTDRGVQAWTIRPRGLERLDNFKIKYQTYCTYSIEILGQG